MPEIDQKLWRECVECAKQEPKNGWPHRLLGTVDGNRVFLSDYNHIFLRHDRDFNQGGNDLEDSGLCSPKTLVLDDRIRRDDWPFILYHEAIERRHMEKGWSYDKAHKLANEHEYELRSQYTHQPDREQVMSSAS